MGKKLDKQLDSSQPPSQGDVAPRRSKRLQQQLKEAAVAATNRKKPRAGRPGQTAEDPCDKPSAAANTCTLPSALMLHCLEFLPPNELACSGRLAFKDAAQRFSSPAHCTVHLSQPLPDRVADSWPALQGTASTALRSLTFRRKLGLLSTAATSGSETNMRVAWQLLQPCVFPDVLRERYAYDYDEGFDADERRGHSMSQFAGSYWGCRGDPGAAAVRAGHVRLLRWMLEHRIPVMASNTLKAVAYCCSLAELQEAAQLLQQHRQFPFVHDHNWWDRVAEFAAASRTPDAQAKAEWVLRNATAYPKSHGGDPIVIIMSSRALSESALKGRGDPVPSQPTLALAISAAGAGNLPLLQWLRDQQCPMSDSVVLGAALEHAQGLEVADWLLDEAVCPLPADRRYGDDSWKLLCGCAAASGSVAKLRWLAARAGGPLHVSAGEVAAECGRLGALQYLHADGALVLSRHMFCLAAGSGRLELLAWLRGQGCPMDWAAYLVAADYGHMAALRWLAQEARCSGLDNPDLVETLLHVWGTAGLGARGLAEGGAPEAGWDAAGAGAVAEGGCGSSSSTLEVIRFLVESGCPLVDDKLLDNAAALGDLGLVQYLHEQGMSFGEDAMIRAAGSGCEALVEWLVREQGCRAGPQADCDPYLEAGKRGDVATMACLRELGVRWNRYALRGAAELELKLEVVQWMVQHGAPSGRDVINAAIMRANMHDATEVADWLSELEEKEARKRRRAVGNGQGQGKGRARGRGRGARGRRGRNGGGK